MSVDQLSFVMAFNSIPNLGVGDVMRLLAYYENDAAVAWQEYRNWPQLPRLSADKRHKAIAFHDKIDPEQLLEQYLNYGCSSVTWFDEEYPPALRNIYDPPLMLFYHGRLPDKEELCLALIGSRRATPYGRQVAEMFSRELASRGAVIVSGMARGIDSEAHRAALAVGGRTVAVLGSGLDVIYPRENDRLYAQICSSGAVVSEFPLATPAEARNFPRRNRIISGLCEAIIVAEASERSGTLSTVHYAAEQGRDVFVVPGNITSRNSRGTNKMIRDDGVKIALAPEDVCLEYGSRLRPHEQPPAASSSVSGLEARLLELLREPQTMDSLLANQSLGVDAAALTPVLTMMELRGLLRKLPGNYFQTIIKNIRY